CSPATASTGYKKATAAWCGRSLSKAKSLTLNLCAIWRSRQAGNSPHETDGTIGRKSEPKDSLSVSSVAIRQFSLLTVASVGGSRLNATGPKIQTETLPVCSAKCSYRVMTNNLLSPSARFRSDIQPAWDEYLSDPLNERKANNLARAIDHHLD